MASYIVTGIHAAARAGKLQKVQDYISKGGDVNKPDREHCSPLMWACWGGHVEIVKRLLDEGARPDTFSHQHASAMHWATWGGHTEIVKLLLEHKVPLDESDEQDGTPLHYAAKKGFVGLAKVLLGAGATVDVRNVKSMTPLHLACHYNKVEVARFLILKHAAVGSVDHINRTPLHYACLKSHINSVRLLLEWGAEVMVIDNKGKLPLHLVGQSASQKNRAKSDDIKKLLKSKMPEDDDEGLDGSYHPESDGTLMGAAMSVAKNVASNSPASSMVTSKAGATLSKAAKDVEAAGSTDGPRGESSFSNGDTIKARGKPEESVSNGVSTDELNGGEDSAAAAVGKTPKVEVVVAVSSTVSASAGKGGRKSTFGLALGTGSNHRQTLESRGAADRRSSGQGSWALGDRVPNIKAGSPGPDGVSPMGPISPDVGDRQRARKKSTINITMNDGMVSIADGKATGEPSPTSSIKRRGAGVSAPSASAAPATGSRAKRSPQGSVAGESSTTKGSERDDMEEVSNEEVAYEMALEQIIADLDDIEERVENLNVDQKTNEDILLNVLKRVDETEKDLRKIKRATLAKDFEAKQTSAAAAGEVERTLGSEPPMSGNPGGVSGSASPDWTSLAGETFASKDEVGELRQAVAMKDKELREIRTLVLDKETELDTLRKAGKNLRERLDEKEVETRGIMDRLSVIEDIARKAAASSGGCNCSVM